MTQETPRAGDSAPETITLVDPVTGEQTTADIDEPDHGIITMDLGEFATEPEPYRRTYRVTMDLADGTRILIEDAADGQTFVSLIADDDGTALSFHLTDDESNWLRSSLMNADHAADNHRHRG